MRKISLTQGQFALVPNERFQELSKWKWQAQWSDRSQTFYAVHNFWNKEKRKYAVIQMHRVILNAPKGVHVDHKDGNGLNNTLGNIRLAPGGSNHHNRRIGRNNTSGFKGVFWEKNCSKWRVQIVINYKKIQLGLFEGVLDAARVYNEAALKYHGEFARLNEILEDLAACH